MKIAKYIGICLILICFGCTKQQSNDTKIGAILPLTGDAGSYGAGNIRGTQYQLIGNQGVAKVLKMPNAEGWTHRFRPSCYAFTQSDTGWTHKKGSRFFL